MLGWFWRLRGIGLLFSLGFIKLICFVFRWAFLGGYIWGALFLIPRISVGPKIGLLGGVMLNAIGPQNGTNERAFGGFVNTWAVAS